MKILRLCLSGFLFLAFAAWGQSSPLLPLPDDAKAKQLIEQGAHLLQAHKPAEALPYFDQVVALYQSRFKDANMRYYSARTPTEALFYMTDAALADGKRGALAASGNWGYAHYLKGYALLDLGRPDEAKAELLRATALSPQNAQFLGELGHVYEVEKNWPLAMQTFERAEKAAKEFSPDNARNAELARAWRGEGYALVELGRLDEAEALYRKCLGLDPQDETAKQELAYVLSQKAKGAK
jgi:Flp pilus assembly protein TadD